MRNQSQHPFKWRQFQPEIIVLCVCWYLRYSLSYRDLEEMMLERGLHVDHTTIYRWVQEYAPELEKRCRPHLKATNDSWRVDETSIKVKKQWVYLYRAVDSDGKTLEFLLSPTRDAEAAERFFCKALHATTGCVPQGDLVEEQVIQFTRPTPRVINVDKNAAYPKAIADLKAAGMLAEVVELRSDRAGPSIHQEIDKARDGLLFLQDRVANPPRIRDHEHDEERARARGGKR